MPDELPKSEDVIEILREIVRATQTTGTDYGMPKVADLANRAIRILTFECEAWIDRVEGIGACLFTRGLKEDRPDYFQCAVDFVRLVKSTQQGEDEHATAWMPQKFRADYGDSSNPMTREGCKALPKAEPQESEPSHSDTELWDWLDRRWKNATLRIALHDNAVAVYDGIIGSPRTERIGLGETVRDALIAAKSASDDLGINALTPEQIREMRESATPKDDLLRRKAEAFDVLLAAVVAFRKNAGRHDGWHHFPVGLRPCERCEESYVREESELDKALQAAEAVVRGEAPRD